MVKVIKKLWTNIFEIIALHYYDLKDIAVRETRKFTNGKEELNMDLFHSGLMRMISALSHTPVTLKQVKGYWCNLYKHALLRECMYARNKYKDENEFNENFFESKLQDMDASVDLQVVLSDIQTNFGKDYQIFLDYVDGYTLTELDKKYNIKNADYRIRKIKKYVQQTYPEIGIGRRKRKKQKGT